MFSGGLYVNEGENKVKDLAKQSLLMSKHILDIVLYRLSLCGRNSEWI